MNERMTKRKKTTKVKKKKSEQRENKQQKITVAKENNIYFQCFTQDSSRDEKTRLLVGHHISANVADSIYTRKDKDEAILNLHYERSPRKLSI